MPLHQAERALISDLFVKSFIMVLFVLWTEKLKSFLINNYYIKLFVNQAVLFGYDALTLLVFEIQSMRQPNPFYLLSLQLAVIGDSRLIMITTRTSRTTTDWCFTMGLSWSQERFMF